MRTPLRATLSQTVGWLSDRRIPGPLRAPLFRTYARCTGADLGEIALPLDGHACLAAFFVRRLKAGARVFEADPDVLPAPADGVLQDVSPIATGSVLRAKGREYSLAELLGPAGTAAEFEGGHAWTIYLSPRHYHRVHAPVSGALVGAHWIDGAQFSVRPSVVARRPQLYLENERCALRIETEAGPVALVMVGALNVRRIRVVGLNRADGGRVEPPRSLARGDELARFELGSTVVLVAPGDGFRPRDDLAPGSELAMGSALGLR